MSSSALVAIRLRQGFSQGAQETFAVLFATTVCFVPGVCLIYFTTRRKAA